MSTITKIYEGKGYILSQKWVEECISIKFTKSGAARMDTNSGFGKTRIKNKIFLLFIAWKWNQKIIFDKTNDLLIVATAGNYENGILKIPYMHY